MTFAQEWIGRAAGEGGGQVVGCTACGETWDLLDLVELGALQKVTLPCGDDAAAVFPLAELRKPETYGFTTLT